RWIRRTVNDVLVRTYGEHVLEAVRRLDTSYLGKLDGITRPVFGAQQIAYANLVEHRCEKLWMLNQSIADERPAGAHANGRQLGCGRVLLRDEIACAGDEVVHAVLPISAFSRQMPGLAELATTANVGSGENAPAPQPGQLGRIEGRRHGNAIGTVAIELRRVASIECHAAHMHDRKRHPRAVGAYRDGLFGSKLTCIDSWFRFQVLRRYFIRGGIVKIISTLSRPGVDTEKHPRLERIRR